MILLSVATSCGTSVSENKVSTYRYVPVCTVPKIDFEKIVLSKKSIVISGSCLVTSGSKDAKWCTPFSLKFVFDFPS